jgi:hypothetical protein
VTLPSDTTLLITAGSLLSNATHPYGKITVPPTTRLVFDDPGADGHLELDVMGMVIDGAVEAGSATCRLEGRLTITLHGAFGSGNSSERHLISGGQGTNDDALKGIVVSANADARLDLHGALFFPTWTRLAAHVPGAAPQSTTAPQIRNSVVYLQDCVNWRAGQLLLVTSSHHKDVRGYHFNEQRIIAAGGVRCVSVDGRTYGQLTLTQPLAYYHHAGAHEYQVEVALLSRQVVVRGNEASEVTCPRIEPH